MTCDIRPYAHDGTRWRELTGVTGAKPDESLLASLEEMAGLVRASTPPRRQALLMGPEAWAKFASQTKATELAAQFGARVVVLEVMPEDLVLFVPPEMADLLAQLQASEQWRELGTRLKELVELARRGDSGDV